MTSKEIDKILKSPVTKGAKGRFISIEQLEQIKTKLKKSEKQCNPTLSDCIKEWKDNGFTVTVSDMTITISNCDTVDDIREEMEIEIHLVLKTIYYMDDVELTFDLQNLLSKTIKAVEVEKNGK